MIRKHAYILAALASVVVLIGGTYAVVRAQQPAPDAVPATGATTKSAAPVPKGPANAAPGGFPGGGAFGGAPGAGARTGAGGGVPGMMPPMGMTMGLAADDDPEMTELAQAEAGLAGEASEILAHYSEAETAADRKKIAVELRESLAKQFDVQKQRRELELGRIEEQVRKLRDQLKKRTDARETIIDRRLDQLINEAEGLGWAPPAPAGRGPNATADMMRSMRRGAGGRGSPVAR